MNENEDFTGEEIDVEPYEGTPDFTGPQAGGNGDQDFIDISEPVPGEETFPNA